jgi:hypothetical protein
MNPVPRRAPRHSGRAGKWRPHLRGERLLKQPPASNVIRILNTCGYENDFATTQITGHMPLLLLWGVRSPERAKEDVWRCYASNIVSYESIACGHHIQRNSLWRGTFTGVAVVDPKRGKSRFCDARHIFWVTDPLVLQQPGAGRHQDNRCTYLGLRVTKVWRVSWKGPKCCLRISSRRSCQSA